MDLRPVVSAAAVAVCTVMAATNSRTFSRMLLLEETAETSANVSIGDLNGDGFPDLLLAKGRHWPLHNRILLNDGHYKFRIAYNLGEKPDRTYSTALADLDGDGDLDIVVGNDAPDPKLVYRNDGKGKFELAGTYGRPEWPTRNITLADLNGDGRPDIIVANRGGDPRGPTAIQSYVCFNDGKGNFPNCQPIPVTSATTIAAADLDGDHAIDLIVPNRDGGRSVILWNDGKGSFPQSTDWGLPESRARAVATGDLNGDGLPDIVVGDERSGTFLFPNQGRRSISKDPVLLVNKDRTPYAVAIADLNRDGRADVVIGYVEKRGSVLLNDGSGRTFKEVPWNDGKGAVYGLAIGDLNGDGWPDIAAARTGAPNAVWFSTSR